MGDHSGNLGVVSFFLVFFFGRRSHNKTYTVRSIRIFSHLRHFQFVGVSASRTFLSPFTKGTRVLALVIRFLHFCAHPMGIILQKPPPPLSSFSPPSTSFCSFVCLHHQRQRLLGSFSFFGRHLGLGARARLWQKSDIKSLKESNIGQSPGGESARARNPHSTHTQPENFLNLMWLLEQRE